MRKKYKVAVVFEPIMHMGGGVKQLQSIIKAFPNADLYTAYYNPELVKEMFPNINIKTSFMQNLPKMSGREKAYTVFQPRAYRSFSFKEYDVVISLSIGFCKFINTGSVKHIALVMSPPKFLWQKDDRSIKDINQLKGVNKFAFKIYQGSLGQRIEDNWREEDMNAVKGASSVVAISKTVQDRIKKIYGVDSKIIYPPVEVSLIKKRGLKNRKENWFLYLGRIETYKGVDLAIKACVNAGVPLKIAGTGSQLDDMCKLVKKLKAKGLIKLLGYVDDETRLELLSKCKALIFPVKGEDFGIIPVEANASGSAVIAYRDGGATETISESNPRSGVFFDRYTVKDLEDVIKKFNPNKYDPVNCQKQADLFAEEIFIYKLQNHVEDVIQSS